MRGLSLTRKEGQNVILHVDQGGDKEPLVLGVITVQRIEGNRVRLRLACRPTIRIMRYDDDVELEVEKAEGQ